MNEYMILEIGDSAYTEFKMKNGKFQFTEDGILVDRVKADSEEKALNQLNNNPNHQDKEFDNLIIRKVAS